ncbi:MAG: phosphoenolpyruvate--protein phosphotransferase [Clostridia bacterium]|nr:phosphoenolpyruvate--protein phosphotransferase [Clostridia bacterium]
MVAIRGTGVSSGIALGKLIYYKRKENTPNEKFALDSASELAKWKNASEKAKKQLAVLADRTRREVGDEAAELFETHQLMIDDLDYTERIASLIVESKKSAVTAVEIAGKEFSKMFAAMDDDYMKARSVDVIDISHRITDILCDNQSIFDLKGEQSIIVADDLTPSETVQLDKSLVIGFVLSEGNANSHTAILARTLGIPAIIGANTEWKDEYEGRQIMIDGSVGYIVIDPDDTTKEYLLKKQQEEKAVRTMLEKLKGCSDITLDGKEIKVYANITHPADIDAVIANDARGIGLFRSEFLYLESDDYPTEETQFEAYKYVVQRMNGQRVIIRTLDIGADKKIDYFGLEKEVNPALGMRALRLCLSRPEIFKTQLRALYRASAYGKLSIMLPLVTSLWEVQEVKRMCDGVKKSLQKDMLPYDEKLEIGIMIETPAAVMIAPDLAKEVSFFSIGTNDLLQYTVALDRQSTAALDRFQDNKHPALLKMIKMTVDAAHDAGIWAGICGEIAADSSMTEVFLKMGVDELSVSPRAVLPVRNIVRQTVVEK